MNRPDRLTDELIQTAFERRARRATPRGLRDDILAATTTTRQRAAWRLRLANAFATPLLPPAWIALIVLAVVLGIALALALVGQRPQPLLRTGLLAYSTDHDVYLANADGSDATRVVHRDDVGFSALTWSPDGRGLALYGFDAVSASEAVFLLDPGSLELRLVGAGHGVVWSSDSRALAFATSSASGAGVIEIVRVDTGAVRVLQSELTGFYTLSSPLAWSPNGRWILAIRGVGNSGQPGSLVRIDATTGDTVEIAPMYHLSQPGAHWSPDSRWFAYARPDSCGGEPPCPSTIVVEAADLSQVIAIGDPGKLASSPVWSPDGTWIAFASATLLPSPQNPGPNVSAPALSIVSPDGRDLRLLAHTTALAFGGALIETLSWNAEGTAVEFRGSDLGVYEVRLGEGSLRSVGLVGGLSGYAWQAIPAERPVPTLPIPRSPASSTFESIAP